MIIDDSLARSAGSFDAHEAVLASTLRALPIEEIESFAKLFYEFRQMAYRWDLWAAAYLVGGGCSDDSFMDFRSWLISRGQTVYDRVLKDPDNLAEIEAGQDYFFEGFQYIPRQVYEERSGKKLSGLSKERESPAKPEWNFDLMTTKKCPAGCRDYG